MIRLVKIPMIKDQALFNKNKHISNFIETKQGYGKDHHKFWPPLDLRYAGTDDTDELKSFMDNALHSVTNARPLKLYCQLTTTAEDIILKRYNKMELFLTFSQTCRIVLSPQQESFRSNIFGCYRRGLRELADQSNRNVTRWWNTEYSYPEDLSEGVLVTLHDFLVSTDMVHFAIEKNKKNAIRKNSMYYEYPSIIVV